MTTPLRVHGVDISHHQVGNIGWIALREAGVRWMYHKATEGETYKDPNYERRRSEARSNGMPFGAYHFARPSSGDARREARFFIGVAAPLEGDLRPCLDLEVNEGMSMSAVRQWADDFCSEVERMTGVIPVIYTPYTLSDELEKRAIFWVPRYNNDNHPPERRWDIWQFSNGAFGVPNKVPGLGHVDLNHSKVGLQQLVIPRQPTSRGKNVDMAIVRTKAAEKRAEEGTQRDNLLDRALSLLKRIKPTR